MSDVPDIVACLRAYREHVRQGRRRIRQMPRLLLLNDLDDLFSPKGEVEEMLLDPIRSALRGRVREIAWRAYMRGGLAEMERLLDATEEEMPEAPSFAGATLDKWFDGIGEGTVRWCPAPTGWSGRNVSA